MQTHLPYLLSLLPGLCAHNGSVGCTWISCRNQDMGSARPGCTSPALLGPSSALHRQDGFVNSGPFSCSAAGVESITALLMIVTALERMTTPVIKNVHSSRGVRHNLFLASLFLTTFLLIGTIGTSRGVRPNLFLPTGLLVSSLSSTWAVATSIVLVGGVASVMVGLACSPGRAPTVTPNR